MRRRPNRLRGSVTQNTPSVRLRAQNKSRMSFLIRFGVICGLILLFVGLMITAWRSGWPRRQAENLVETGLHVTQKAQFAVKDIVVEGRNQVNKDALFNALGTIAGAPIFSFDPALAQSRIARLPWVASAIVERRLPDTIVIRLIERTPMARWQHENLTVVIDNQGDELPEAKVDQFSDLPLVVGSDAAGQARGLLDTLKDFPAITQHMTAAVRVGERRWDLHLQPKVVAKLPEKDMLHALNRLSDLINDQKILERDIVAIDLRDPTRLVLEPGGATPAFAGDQHL